MKQIIKIDGLATQTPPGSLNRASLLLRVIAQGSRKGTSLAEFVARTSLPRPTIHRILNMLIELGWVNRDPDTSRFNLGVDLAALGLAAISRNPIEKVANIHMAVLAQELNQFVYLNIRSRLDTVCIAVQASESQAAIAKGWEGMRMPFGLSPACMAMLAKLSAQEIGLVLDANMARYYRVEGFDERSFRQAVDQTVEAGFCCYEDILFDKAISGLGVSINDPNGYPIAGLTTTYIRGSLNKEQKAACVSKLLIAADNITKALTLKVEK